MGNERLFVVLQGGIDGDGKITEEDGACYFEIGNTVQDLRAALEWYDGMGLSCESDYFADDIGLLAVGIDGLRALERHEPENEGDAVVTMSIVVGGRIVLMCVRAVHRLVFAPQ